MSEKVSKIKDYVEDSIATLEYEISEIVERYEDGFDPQDWSGGNFDDAYVMGKEEGFTRGQYSAYKKILRILNEKEGAE